MSQSIQCLETRNFDPIVYCTESQSFHVSNSNSAEFQKQICEFESVESLFRLSTFLKSHLRFQSSNPHTFMKLFWFNLCVTEIFRIERWDRKLSLDEEKFEIRISSNSNFFNFFFLLRFHSKLTSSHIYEIIFLKFMCDEDLSNREIRSKLTSQEKNSKFEFRIWRNSSNLFFLFFRDFEARIHTFMKSFWLKSCVTKIFRIDRWDRNSLLRKKIEIRISWNFWRKLSNTSDISILVSSHLLLKRSLFYFIKCDGTFSKRVFFIVGRGEIFCLWKREGYRHQYIHSTYGVFMLI